VTVLVLTTDLLLQSQLAGAVERAEQPVHVVGSVDGLVSALETGPARLVILDLSLSAIDPSTLVPQLKQKLPDTTIAAFAPHVHRQRLADAKAAGCDVVMSRGQFHAEAEALLRQAHP
jgi:DNA-binding NarL/FixJ family response regulator